MTAGHNDTLLFGFGLLTLTHGVCWSTRDGGLAEAEAVGVSRGYGMW